MLGRHMFGYAPSLFVTALTSFASVSFFTSWMTRQEYGQYSLAINAMTMLIGVSFFWLQSASSRLMPQAVEQGTQLKLFTTLYSAFAGCGVALLALSLCLIGVCHLGDWRVAVWFAAPLAILRALLNMNQSIHRNFVRIGRYNIIEIGQALTGLASAAVLIIIFHFGASGAALGTAIGFAAMTLFDWKILASVRLKYFDRAVFWEIVQFGGPFIVTFGLSFVLSGSDRFLIEYFLGSDQVGIYSAGYAIPDRIGQNIFMAVATASFPLVVRRLEAEGNEAARDQTYINGVALLALSVPACVGMLLTSRQLAAVLIGQDFREGALTIMPWITVATILNGIAAHYFDHAFHLAKRTRLFFFTLGPAALINFFGNLYTIPRYGIVGAAWTTLVAYAVYLALSVIIGRTVFKIKFPLLPAIQIVLCTVVMGIVLSAFRFQETALGLVEMVILGACVYALGLLAFNILSSREILLKLLNSRKTRSESRQGRHQFAVLTSQQEVDAIGQEWCDLFRRGPGRVFGDHTWLMLWWRLFGSTSGYSLRVYIGRDMEGRLSSVLPLVVHRRNGLRLLEWAGHEVFDYGDVVALNADAAAELWIFVRADTGYDLASIKDVHTKAFSLPVVSSFMKSRESRRNYFLALDYPSGNAWLAAQSRKLRGDFRRKMDKLQERGEVVFNIFENGQDLPSYVVDQLHAQKKSWFTNKGASGIFSEAKIGVFLNELCSLAAERRELYLAWLTCGDSIIACHMGFVVGNILFLYHTTYDAAFASFSPGNAMMVETIKAATDARLVELDFMRGDESYKQRFASGFRSLSSFIFGKSVLGRLAVSVSDLYPKRDGQIEERSGHSET